MALRGERTLESTRSKGGPIMGANDNIKAIQAVYEAFGRGDVAAILEAVTDDVDWATEASSKSAPCYGVKRGKAGVTAFFEAFGSAMEVEEFRPVTFAANDTDVLTVVRFRCKSRATGKALTMDLHHYFVFSGDKIAYYRGTEDTEQTAHVLS
jgi:ketosteroid isomerase-like protein